MHKFLNPLLGAALFATTATAQLSSHAPPVVTRTSNGCNLDWAGQSGVTYFIQYSLDLQTWSYMPVIESGAGVSIGYGFQCDTDRMFVRLHYTDIPTSSPSSDDFDGDGISNWDEIRAGGTGTSPLKWDTDGDGKSDYFADSDGNTIADGWEIKHFGALGVTLAAADPDGDGLTNSAESQLDTSPDAHADTSDEDGDGVVDALDAVPDDPLINWPKKLDRHYAYIELETIQGMYDITAVDLGEGAHVLASAWPDGSAKTGVNRRDFVFDPASGEWSAPLKKTYNGETGDRLYAHTVDSQGKVAGTAWMVDVDANGQVSPAYAAACEWATASADPLAAAGTRFAATGENASPHADADTRAPQYAPDDQLLRMKHGTVYSSPSVPATKVEYGGVDLDDYWAPLGDPPDTLSGLHYFGHPGRGLIVPMTRLDSYYDEDAGEYDWKVTASYLYENGQRQDIATGTSAGYLYAAGKMPDDKGMDGAGRVAVTGDHTWIRKDGTWAKTRRPLQGNLITSEGIVRTSSTEIWNDGQRSSLNQLSPSLAAKGYATTTVSSINDKGMMLLQSETQSGVSTLGLMLPMELVSRDRMLAGSLRIPEGWEDRLEIEIVHKTSGENLGKHGHLLSKQNGAYLYDAWWEIHGDDEAVAYDTNELDPRVESERIVFCKREGEDRVIEFYAAFGQVGDIEIRLYLDGERNGEVSYELTQESTFGGIINYINMLVTESPFGANQQVWANGASTVVAQQPPPASIDPQALRTMVQVLNGLNVGLQFDMESIIYGLCDGIVQGLHDDWELVKLLGLTAPSAILQIGDQVQAKLVQELQRWHASPVKRALEISSAIRRVIRHALMEPLQQLANELPGAAARLADNFSSFEKLRRFHWQLLQRAKKGVMGAWKIGKDIDAAVFGAMRDWISDFGARMYEGSEKSLFLAEPWGSVNDWRNDLRAGYYTFGYVFGYLAEQVLLGKGIAAMGKGMTKLGAKIALTALPHVKRLGARMLPFVAKAFSRLKLGGKSGVETVGIVKGNGKAMQHATGKTVGNRPLTETVDEWLELQDIAKFSGKDLVDEITKLPRIRTLYRTPGFRHVFKDRLAKIAAILGNDLSEDAMKGFIRAYDRLIKTADGVNFEDRFDDFIVLFKAEDVPAAKRALKESLENFKAVTDANPNVGSPLLYFKRIDEVQDTMYRYSNFVPEEINGIRKLSARSDEGWYVTFDKFNDATTAKGKAQLPPENTAKYRLEFETSAVKDKAYVPYGNQMDSPIKEPLARDFPNNGVGGATQLLVKDQEIPIKAVYELIDGQYVKIWPSP